MISGIDLKETVDYVCKEDKDNPTTWKLGALSSRKLAKGSVSANAVEKLIEVVRYGLRGWTNFKLAGKDIEFKNDADGLNLGLVDIIPLNVIVELGTEILRLNKLSGQETKN